MPLRIDPFRVGPLAGCLAPLDLEPDLAAFAAQRLTRPLIWLDSARRHPVTGRWSLLGCDPWLTLTCRGGVTELRTSAATQRRRTHPLTALHETLARYQTGSSLGAAGRVVGLMGFLSYEMNRWIERLPAPQPSSRELPDMLWFGMRLAVLVDHAEHRSWVVSVADPHAPPAAARRQARETLDRALSELTAPEAIPPDAASWSDLRHTSTQPEFETMVRRALAYIRAGDIFQANLSQRFTASWRGSAFRLYQALRRINPSPFACFLSSEELSVVSCSPERLVRVQEGRADTRPIAGTRPRGMTPAEDALQSLELLLSEKERAEHVMLVDLARNDLGRVCAAGSVGVTELMALEAYSHVHHIVSDVSGELRPAVGAAEVIRALFPGGTITGCPKVRCMEIVRELEPVARGLYTGSLGYLGFDGTMDLNIAIRTMTIQQEQLSFHAGAGIVADSDPEREYHETLAKAAALRAALEAVNDPEPLHAGAG